jgi:hypothetical protein
VVGLLRQALIQSHLSRYASQQVCVERVMRHTFDSWKLQVDFSNCTSDVEALDVCGTSVSEGGFGRLVHLHQIHPRSWVLFKCGQIGFNPRRSFSHWICANLTKVSPSTITSHRANSGSSKAYLY